MGITLQVNRYMGELVSAVELVDSPDDGGWYLVKTDFCKRVGMTSAKIYKSESAARDAFRQNKVKWEA